MKRIANKLILILIATVLITSGIIGLFVIIDTYPPGQVIKRNARFNGDMAGWSLFFFASLFILIFGIYCIYYIGVAEGKNISKFDNFLQD